MAYFRCSTGSASSGDGVALIVECDVNFAGSTITADNGEDVFTETCPSVSPYTVRFEGIPTGTYTISGITLGHTFTTQFTVLDYETTLRSIPEGATVLPVNDIQIWLHCADIWDKNYTTISQVLADASTLQALIASNNAADYMARSTTWASNVCADANAMTYIGANNYCAKKLLSDATWCGSILNSTYWENVINAKIPVMTSNTTPSGKASSSGYYSGGYEPYKAFDGTTSTYGWCPNGGSGDKWLQYKFTQKNIFKKMYFYTDGSAVTITKIQGSNDGNTFTDIPNTGITVPNNSSAEAFVIANNTEYMYYRAYITGYNLGNWYGMKMQLYGRAEV